MKRYLKPLAVAAALVWIMATGAFAHCLERTSSLGWDTQPTEQIMLAHSIPCPVNEATSQDFRSGDRVVETVRVLVCIDYFDQLRGAPSERWWGMNLTSMPNGGYKRISAPCKWQNIPRGHRAWSDPSCFPGWRYATDPVTRATNPDTMEGIYWLKPWRQIQT